MNLHESIEQVEYKTDRILHVLGVDRCQGVTGEGCPSFNVLEAGELCCDECMEIYEGASHLIHPHRPFTSGGER